MDDPEYRYKMPTVFGKLEGRGNGSKTVIPNVSDVGLSLHRDPGEVNKVSDPLLLLQNFHSQLQFAHHYIPSTCPLSATQFFGCELGSQTTYNPETDRAIVNGHHTDIVLQQLMHKYIESFVLCPNCRLPETEYKIKSGVIFHKCAACGAKEMVDMTHKLCTYIIAQDKKAKAEAKKEGKKKDKKKEKKDGNSDDGDEDEKKKVRFPQFFFTANIVPSP